MPQVRLESDHYDNNKIHIYYRQTYHTFGRTQTRMFHACSMHTDAIESVFGKDVTEQMEEIADTLDVRVDVNF